MDWQKPLAEARKLEVATPRKWELTEQFANALGAAFLQGHQCVQHRTDRMFELRGRFHDYPARLLIFMPFMLPRWELRGTNPASTELTLEWDEKAVPDVGEFQGGLVDDWGDARGPAKVFFGKGYYLDRASDRELAVYQALPGEVREALVANMVSDHISRYYLHDSGNQELKYRDKLEQMTDPLNQTARGVWLMAQVAGGLAQVDVAALPAPTQQAAVGTIERMTCGYCRSLYLSSQNQACPNCGAPPQA